MKAQIVMLIGLLWTGMSPGCYQMVDMLDGDGGNENNLENVFNKTPPESTEYSGDIHACGALDCRSSADNDCNGYPDNQELVCVAAGNVATPNTRPCNTHPGFDGIGECRAGVQTRLGVELDGTAIWSDCEGDVAPSMEACGPTAPDTNCNGIQGDGDGCMVDITLYGNHLVVSPWCGYDSGWTSIIDDGIIATTGTVPQYYEKLTTIRGFAELVEGTLPVRNCLVWNGYNEGISGRKFVKIGENCDAMKEELYTEDNGIVGYISVVPAEGYSSLPQLWERLDTYIHNFHDLAFIPVAECPFGCECSASEFYSVQ